MPPLPGGNPPREEQNAKQNPTVSGIEPMPPAKTHQIFAAQGHQGNQRIGPPNSRAKQEQDAESTNQGTQGSRLSSNSEQKAQQAFPQNCAQQSTADDWERQREI